MKIKTIKDIQFPYQFTPIQHAFNVICAVYKANGKNQDAERYWHIQGDTIVFGNDSGGFANTTLTQGAYAVAFLCDGLSSVYTRLSGGKISIVMRIDGHSSWESFVKEFSSL